MFDIYVCIYLKICGFCYTADDESTVALFSAGFIVMRSAYRGNVKSIYTKDKGGRIYVKVYTMSQ